LLCSPERRWRRRRRLHPDITVHSDHEARADAGQPPYFIYVASLDRVLFVLAQRKPLPHRVGVKAILALKVEVFTQRHQEIKQFACHRSPSLQRSSSEFIADRAGLLEKQSARTICPQN